MNASRMTNALATPEAIDHWMRLCTAWHRFAPRGARMPQAFRLLVLSAEQLNAVLRPLSLLCMGTELRSLHAGGSSGHMSGVPVPQRRWALQTLAGSRLPSQAMFLLRSPEGWRQAFLTHLLALCTQSGIEYPEPFQTLFSHCLGVPPSPMQVELPASAWDSLLMLAAETPDPASDSASSRLPLRSALHDDDTRHLQAEDAASVFHLHREMA